MKNLKEIEIFYDLEDEINDDELTEIHIGDLNLTSGKIIAADPFFTQDHKPFARSVAPGKYPIYIYVTEIDEDHHRVAYAKIKFRTEKVTKWILAITEDLTTEELNDLGEDEFYGFAVEAGLACFMDEETNKILLEKMQKLDAEKPESNYYDEVLAKEFEEYSGKNKLSRTLGDWNNHFPKKDSDNNVIMFASGWGDGYYPSYWSLNDNGECVELVIDFLINEFEDEDDADFIS